MEPTTPPVLIQPSSMSEAINVTTELVQKNNKLEGFCAQFADDQWKFTGSIVSLNNLRF